MPSKHNRFCLLIVGDCDESSVNMWNGNIIPGRGEALEFDLGRGCSAQIPGSEELIFLAKVGAKELTIFKTFLK